MHDKIFSKKIVLENVNNVTLIFNEFIKGMTYFSYQQKEINKHPIYHRLFSCGDGSHSFRNNFNRCNDKNKKDAQRRIKTCYI